MSNKQGTKGKKNTRKKPCNARYLSEMRWTVNARKRAVREQKRQDRCVAKHARRKTLGYRARQLVRETLCSK